MEKPPEDGLAVGMWVQVPAEDRWGTGHYRRCTLRTEGFSGPVSAGAFRGQRTAVDMCVQVPSERREVIVLALCLPIHM